MDPSKWTCQSEFPKRTIPVPVIDIFLFQELLSPTEFLKTLPLHSTYSPKGGVRQTPIPSPNTLLSFQKTQGACAIPIRNLPRHTTRHIKKNINLPISRKKKISQTVFFFTFRADPKINASYTVTVKSRV